VSNSNLSSLGISQRSFTIAAWVKLDDVNDQYIVGNWAGDAADTFAVGVGGNHPYMRIGSNEYYGSNTVGTGQWHHLVFRNQYNNSPPTSRLAMYLDGTLVFSQTESLAV